MRRIRASWDCADFEDWGQREVLERKRLCGDRVATKLPTIAETMERCVAGVCVAGKERERAAGNVIGADEGNLS